MKRCTPFFGFILCLVTLSLFIACGKPRLFGKEMELKPMRKVFPVDPTLAFQATKEALAFQGYNLQKEEAEAGVLETHWQSTTSDSHFVNFFERQDRGTVGAYHKLVVKVSAKGQSSSQIEISSVAQSFVSNLRSTGIEEEKVFKKITDFTRRANIQVTNVGLH